MLLLSGIAASVFTAIALASYDRHDDSLSVRGTGQTENLVGSLGAYLADALYQGFGYAAWLLVGLGVGFALRLAGRPPRPWSVRILGFIGFVLLAIAFELSFGGSPDAAFEPGGVLGHGLGAILVQQIGRLGAALGVGTGLLLVATLLFRIDWQPLASGAVSRLQWGFPAAARGVRALGMGAVRASVRAGEASISALRDRAAPREDEDLEDDDDEGEEAPSAHSAAPPHPTPRRATDPSVRRAPEPQPAPAADPAPLARRARPVTPRVEEPPSAPELPSVWSARRAPTAPPVQVLPPEAERDTPTHVAGRTLVEVEWERTAQLGSSDGRTGSLPPHLRGASPAPITGARPVSVAERRGAGRGVEPVAVQRTPASARESTRAPNAAVEPAPREAPRRAPAAPLRPGLLVPDELDDEPPVLTSTGPVAWADEPDEDVAPSSSSLDQPSETPSVVSAPHADLALPRGDEEPPPPILPTAAAPRVVAPPPILPTAAAPRVVAPVSAAPAPAAPAPAAHVSAAPQAAPPPAASPPSPHAAREEQVEEEEVAQVPVASGPARVAPTGRRPRPSGDGVTVHPGNLKSGGAGDDGRAVRKAKSFELPPLSLLDDHPAIVTGADEAVLHEMARRLTETLRDFQVDGRVTAIRPGPVITMFEYEPAAGVKLSRIANLSDNLKMALKAISVRIVAPLPGRGCVGIEIPNERRQTVWARDVFASPDFKNVERTLPMILGKDTEGRPFVTDLARMPHLLVGGTTGSGKSVGVNSMLVSMLFMRTPDELRMILIDPKMLEFALYEDIPHLLHPVVTEPKFASAVLKWACTEMDERYKIMARWQTRHIDTYNQKVEKELESWTPEKARAYAPKDWPEGELVPIPKKFPYIVIVIDELADLMMVASSDVEASISRIVAKARAAGIHLIVATQTPRRDVITGLIKANMPASLSYQVRSALDSRVILDQNGAESLLGKGDLLFLRPGTSDLVRVHGPFLSEDEVHRVADFLRAQGTPDYDLRISSADGEGEDGEGEAVEYDALYDEAVELAVQKGKISTSMLQRHLGIGYNRAANIVETMEREGVVGPADGARPREVLVGQT